MSNHTHKLAWIGIILGGLALLIALFKPTFAPASYGYDGPRGAQAPAVTAPSDVPGARGEMERQWGQEAPGQRGMQPGMGMDGYHHSGHMQYHRGGYRHFGPTLGSLLLGGALVAGGVWLLRRSRQHRDGPYNPPPRASGGEPQVL